jgi:regulator of sigma E protease
MSALLQAALPFLGIIVFLIVAHEVGHFVTAKLCGVKVTEAGLGLPPRIWGFKWGETEYTINAIPIGAFVRMVGEEDPDEPGSLAAKPRPIRLLVLSAGSIMNAVLAVLLFALALMIPQEVSLGRAVITEVIPGAPAEEAGLQTGDVIYEINGRDVRNVQEAGYNIRLNLGEDVDVTVKRERELLTIPTHARWAPSDIVHVVEPGEDVQSVADRLGFSTASVRAAADIEYILEPGQDLTIGEGPDAIFYTPEERETVTSAARRLGVSTEALRIAAGLPDQNKLEVGQELRFVQGPTGIVIAPEYPFTETQALPPWEALPQAMQKTYEALILARNEVISWFKGAGQPEIAGPVGIAQATGEVVEEAGWKSLVDFAALLSINLAILNILPLPMLDGGRIVFILLEIMRGGRRIAPRKEALVHFVGLVALLTLAVVIGYFDVVRIFSGESILR